MTKQESQALKGVAILLMLFLHLFFMRKNVDLCTHIFHFNDIGLVYYISRMANPVPFFIILSGYGLYAVYKKGDQRRWSRLRKLVLHYWLILLVFVTLGHFIKPQIYPGNISTIIYNLTGFWTTYNGEHWFIFPYLLLAISSPLLFWACDKYKSYFVLGISYILYLASCFLIIKFGDQYLFTHMLAYQPILYGSLLFNFLLGALACKNGWLKKTSRKLSSSLAWILLIGLCILRCLFTTGAFHNLFVFAFIWLWLQTERPKWFDNTLMHFGKHSMNMWLIHTFFCFYFFHDWIYSFRYPLLIYLILLALTYMSSHIINLLYSMPLFFVKSKSYQE